MLADFYIPKLSNDMKLAVQKNNLGGQICYRSLDHVKKRRHKSPDDFYTHQLNGLNLFSSVNSPLTFNNNPKATHEIVISSKPGCASVKMAYPGYPKIYFFLKMSIFRINQTFFFIFTKLRKFYFFFYNFGIFTTKKETI